MAVTIIVLHNQSLLDVAIQQTGTALTAIEIAIANDISITKELTAGSTLLIPDSIIGNIDIKNYYTSKAIQPATDITKIGEEQEEQEGISIWGVNNDFIVQ